MVICAFEYKNWIDTTFGELTEDDMVVEFSADIEYEIWVNTTLGLTDDDIEKMAVEFSDPIFDLI
jgi:hypothetical protein